MNTVLEQIYSMLRYSAPLQEVIGYGNVPVPIYYNHFDDWNNNEGKPYIIIDALPQSDTGCVARMRLQISVITNAAYDGWRVIEAVKKTLITKSDEELTNQILNIVHNGGGSLYDINRNAYHNYIFLDITYRSEV